MHDLDIVVHERDWEDCWKAVMLLNGSPLLPVEFYIASSGNYFRLLHALRSSRYEVISGRLMEGLRFKRKQWKYLKED